MLYCFTEGTRTEPAYLMALAEQYAPEKLTITPAKSTDPQRIIRQAIEHIKVHPEDQAWAILDVETGDSVRRKHLNKAVTDAARFGIQLALSNPSFEYWLLLHELEPPAEQPPVTAQQLHARLSKNWNGYDKVNLPIERLLNERTLQCAKQRAGTPTVEHVLANNPSTNFGALIERLIGS